jgi:hypothetical protein
MVVAVSMAEAASAGKDIIMEVATNSTNRAEEAMVPTCMIENQTHAGLQKAVEGSPRCLVKRCVGLQVWEEGPPLVLVALRDQEVLDAQTVPAPDVKL